MTWLWRSNPSWQTTISTTQTLVPKHWQFFPRRPGLSLTKNTRHERIFAPSESLPLIRKLQKVDHPLAVGLIRWLILLFIWADLDDALHITRLDDKGCYEVGVHIADVSYFLKRNTALDAEARDRATSTYLVDRVIPMLPSLLCEQLCSLNPDVERLAFSVIWKMDSEGNILDTWFGRTIIK